MKKFVLILAGWLVLVGFHNVHADDIGDAVRAAVRRGSGGTSVSARQKSDLTTNTTTRPSTTRATNVTTRGTVTPRTATVVNRGTSTVGTTPTSVVARTTTGKSTVSRTSAPTQSTRSATRATTNRTTTRTASSRNISRAAATSVTRDDVLSRNYSKCRAVFNECMDEFCANKDAQLKRCACSSRINEFNKIKKQLANIDEKMLDFNQRLLTVSMDKEDAAALNIATDGEKAFYDTSDTSESKRTLDAIAKKLNTNFDSSNFSTSLGGALSWSLDMDSAFDSVDSLRGASTTAKSGTALYSAALPVCREMAAEVCSPDDLSIAEGGYMALIEQDCNSVAKTYQSATQQAKSKVLESSALLDISRLNVHQKKNSDDILTCKKKMLEMLTDSTVCGANMEKCLDVTGQYINPATGEAFLSADLANLGKLITRPEDGQTWTGVSGNGVFVTFLNSKKKFLAPAMENCVDIADTVWDAFVEDALSQIKIAQMRKLEEVRQGCTALSAQCLSNASESLTEFDARALSIFGVIADTTTNAMCERVLSSCTTLLNTVDDGNQWYAGVKGIQTDITFETIKQTCNQVGRACIIQTCTSTSGNFGLCENIDTSVARKSVINHIVCWDEVKRCIADAGTDAIERIFTQNNLDTDNKLYSDTYNIPNIVRHTDASETSIATNISDDDINHNNIYIYDMCNTECGGTYSNKTEKCRICRLAESIWGNCEAAPTTPLMTGEHNRIKVPANGNSTLLYWFAQNTNTAIETIVDNCRDTSCGAGFKPWVDASGAIMCVSDKSFTRPADNYCPLDNQFNITSGDSPFTDCCDTNRYDVDYDVASTGEGRNANCCKSDATDAENRCVPSFNATTVATFTIDSATAYYPAGDYTITCSSGTIDSNAGNVRCLGGRYIITRDDTNNKLYMDPSYNKSNLNKPQYTKMYVNGANGECVREYTNGQWQSNCAADKNGGTFTPAHWIVSFGEQN